MNIDELVSQAHDCAVRHGFWPEGQNLAEKVALIHSEASELLEVLRMNSLPGFSEAEDSLTLGQVQGVQWELADIIIRAADLAGYLGVDLESALRKKMAYNASRSYRHGKAF